MMRNVELCPHNARQILGFTAKNKFSYTSQFVDTAASELGLDDRLRVMEVLPQSGAQQAGVTQGDVLLEFNGKPLPTGPEAERSAAVLIISETRGKQQVNLKVDRQGNEMSFDVPLTEACAFGIELGDSDDINSYADGYRVMVTKGMLGFVRSDLELSYVLASEFARNLLATGRRNDMSATIDDLRFLKIGANRNAKPIEIKPYTAAADSAADRLALYMLARSGYALDQYASFWDRLAQAAPEARPNGYVMLHPDIQSRISAIPKFVAAVERKRSRNEPLQP